MPRPPTKFTDEALAEAHEALLADPNAMHLIAEKRGWTETAVRRLQLGWHQDRVLIPVHDQTGTRLGVVSYQPDAGMREYDGGQPKSIYTSGAKRDLVPPPETLDPTKPVAIVEGEPDAILGNSLDIQTVGIGGTSAWKPTDPARFARFPRVTCIPDADQNGRDAMHDIALTLADFTAVHIYDILPGEIADGTSTTIPKGYDLTDHYLYNRDTYKSDEAAATLIREELARAPLWTEHGPARPPGLHNAPDGYTWKPKRLQDLTTEPPAPPTIAGLFYPAAINMLFGEPGTGKSLLAQAIVARHHDQHPTARTLWIDYEQTEPIYNQRNHLVGLNPKADIDYLYDPGRWPQEEVDRLRITSDFEHEHYTLIVVDATQGLYDANGLSINDNDDVARLERLILIPLARTGAAILVLAHVAKDKDGRGRWPIGGQRQLGLVTGAAYSLDTITPYAAGKPGTIKATCAKDRHGNFAIGTTAAHIHIDGDHDSIDARIELHPAEELQAEKEAKAEGTFRYTGLMEKISKHLLQNGETKTSDIYEYCKETSQKGVRKATVLKALNDLVEEGWTELILGPGPKRAYRQTHPFNPDQNPPHTNPQKATVPNRSRPFPEQAEQPFPEAPLSSGATGDSGTVTSDPPEQPTVPVPGTEQKNQPIETCVHCKAPIHGTGYPTAGGLYCCHPCAKGEHCTCGA